MRPPAYRALLIDLDGTLLDIDMDRMIADYLQRLARSFTEFIAPDRFAAHLLEATAKMVRNNDPAAGNETVFFDAFCSRLGQPYDKIYPLFEKFYETEFNHLRGWSNPLPHAGAVIEAARRRNLKLVLATNPIFPLSAVEHRLEWAGLRGAGFDLITTVENMHFCKPNPEYYREIAALIGLQPGRCLMAGNDVEEDLVAAAAGMDTFLVDDFILHRRKEEEPRCNYRGSLRDLAELLKDQQIC